MRVRVTPDDGRGAGSPGRPLGIQTDILELGPDNVCCVPGFVVWLLSVQGAHGRESEVTMSLRVLHIALTVGLHAWEWPVSGDGWLKVIIVSRRAIL